MSDPHPPAARLLVIPGLRDSGPTHWQTWLEQQHRHSVRVVQRDWASTDLDRWAGRIASTLERAAGRGPWIAVAHSFGALAVVRHLALQPGSAVAAVLLVAPADPDRFFIGELLGRARLSRPTTMIISESDPWIAAASARRWAQRWGAPVVSLGDAGHINAEAGFGPLPIAKRWVATISQRLERAAGGAACEPAEDAAGLRGS